MKIVDSDVTGLFWPDSRGWKDPPDGNMKIESIVVVNLTGPQQRFFGRLLHISPAGATIRGIDMDAFEDWMNQIAAGEEMGVQPATTFFPLHRVEKITEDEGIGIIPSLSKAFAARTGAIIEDHLE